MEDIKTLTHLEWLLETNLKVIQLYSWLLDSYLLDFFTENHLLKLSKSWKNLLDCTPLFEFHKIFNSKNKEGNIFPLSIICIKTLLQNLSLPRELKTSNILSDAENTVNSKIDFSKMHLLFENESTTLSFSCPKLWYAFLRHIKPKKRYEILKIAEKAADTATRLKVEYVIDIGSGLGHLSRILAYGFNLNICSIETQDVLISQAKKLDNEFEKVATKYLNASDINKIMTKTPVYLNQTIKPDLNINEFIKTIKTAFSVNCCDFKFGIVGLHPCGDLASILLKIYSNCPEAKFINLVGCCYHKLTTYGDNIQNFGFPMSKYCQKQNASISYEARALSCHAIETYCERLKLMKCDHLKVHCYRATLEKIIHNNWPDLKKSALGNVNAKTNMNFLLYCEKALKKFGILIPEEKLCSQEILNDLAQWQDVAKFYFLRLMFAPIIETIILLDRKLYLLEKGILCQIKAVFDPIISPRNQLLMSEKT